MDKNDKKHLESLENREVEQWYEDTPLPVILWVAFRSLLDDLRIGLKNNFESLKNRFWVI